MFEVLSVQYGSELKLFQISNTICANADNKFMNKQRKTYNLFKGVSTHNISLGKHCLLSK